MQKEMYSEEDTKESKTNISESLYSFIPQMLTFSDSCFL